MKRAVFFAILVVFAMILVTCDLLTPPEAVDEWTDVVYEADGPVGRERVKSVTLYFRPDTVERSALPGPDTYGVKVSPEQRRIIRALSADTAAASHDYFEAVFYPAAANIVRTQWEIGYPAGVSRSQFTLIPATIGGVTSAVGSSAVFVGRKTTKTLLGVGWLTHINDGPLGNNAGQVTDTTYSVTYTVAPIKTWLGFISSTTATAAVPRERSNMYGDAGTGVVTFGTTTTMSVTGGNKAFTPVQGLPSVTYPLYTRTTAASMTAQYRIGGLSGISGSTGVPTNAPASVWSLALVYGTPTGTGELVTTTGAITTPPPKGGMQVIKRKPTFLFQGRTYEAGSIYDSFTTLNSTNNNGTNSNISHGTAFNPVTEVEFNITNQSSGIFAFTFQCPVYAITTLNSRSSNDNIDPNNRFVKWFVRPADGPNLYLLDSGTDEGGMVMLGDTSAISNDWIEIKTTGIGFANN